MTKSLFQTIRELSKEKGYHTCFTSAGAIYVKETKQSARTLISKESDLSKILGPINVVCLLLLILFLFMYLFKQRLGYLCYHPPPPPLTLLTYICTKMTRKYGRS